MKIKSLEIKNFRNYPELYLAINSDTVVLTGPNAAGKTNLLEAIYFASLFKSFRDDTEFIFLKNSDSLELKLVVEKQHKDHRLEIYLQRREKIYANFLLDGVKKKRREMQGFLSVVIFDPTDVDMFNNAPEVRRKYLNMVLSQKNPRYLDSLAAYKRVLFQKNKLLQEIKLGRAKKADLSPWNDQLVEVGSFIMAQRRGFINFLNNSLADIYTTISGFHRPIEVAYQSLPGDTQEQIREKFSEKLNSLAEKEFLLGASLAGPHRDDFFLKSEGLFLSPFSSRGEQRSQILALKILELEFLSSAEEKPVLLLDDVLSELDETRRTFMLKYLRGKFQTFITTTHPLEMPAQHVTLTPATAEKEAKN